MGRILVRYTGLKENKLKNYLLIVRESLYLVGTFVICFAMRPRAKYPSYFGWELDPRPWLYGVAAFDGVTLFQLAGRGNNFKQ